MDRALGDLLPRLMEISQSSNLSEWAYRLDNDYMDWEDYRYKGSVELLIASADECIALLYVSDREATLYDDDRDRMVPAVRSYIADMKASKTLVNGLVELSAALSEFAPTPDDPYLRRFINTIPVFPDASLSRFGRWRGRQARRLRSFRKSKAGS